jgi:Fe-S-cluster-containing hydrogenase component 2
MTYVIASACIDCKDSACVECCPVDAIYEGPRTFYIHPDECVSCGLCVSVCPVEAIYEEDDLPPALTQFTGINREFFDQQVAVKKAAPGGSVAGCAQQDHPLVAAHPARP